MKKNKKKLDELKNRWYIHQIIAWAGSSVGRASALQAEGHRFKPCSAYLNPEQYKSLIYGGVAQFG